MQRTTPRDTGQTSTHPAKIQTTVCVVDPQADEYRAWQATAQARGVRLKICGAVEVALRLAHSRCVDLWVVNTELPGLSGYEVCSMLKDQSPRAAEWLVAQKYSVEAEQAAWRSRASLFGCKPAHWHWLDRIVSPDITYFGTLVLEFDFSAGVAGSVGIDDVNFDQVLPPVPEPSTLALLGLGLVGLAVHGRRRRRIIAA